MIVRAQDSAEAGVCAASATSTSCSHTSGRAFVMFGVRWDAPGLRCSILSGPQNERGELVGKFLDPCEKESGGRASFYQVRPALAAAVPRLRALRLFKLGEDAARAACSDFSLKGAHRSAAPTRRQPRAMRDGRRRSQLMPRAERARVAAGSARASPTLGSREQQRSREKGFSVGSFTDDYCVPAAGGAWCAEDSEIVAFANAADHRQRSARCQPST